MSRVLMFRSGKMRRTGARSSASETSWHMQYWVDYITGTHESSIWKRPGEYYQTSPQKCAKETTFATRSHRLNRERNDRSSHISPLAALHDHSSNWGRPDRSWLWGLWL